MFTLHEDTFQDFFLPYRHPKATFEVWGGIGLETFGSDLQLIQSLDPNNVWTVVDDESGPDQWILPGIHLVNRVCYLVTRRPHKFADISFRAPRRMTSLKPLGLRRQLKQLAKRLDLLDVT